MAAIAQRICEQYPLDERWKDREAILELSTLRCRISEHAHKIIDSGAVVGDAAQTVVMLATRYVYLFDLANAARRALSMRVHTDLPDWVNLWWNPDFYLECSL